MRFWPTVPRVPKAVVLTTMLALAVTLPANSQDTGWSYFGADRAFTRYAAVDQVDANNVDRLEVVWRRPGVDATVLAQWEEQLLAKSFIRIVRQKRSKRTLLQETQGLKKIIN